MKLENFVEGKWKAGRGDGRPFSNPVTGGVLGVVDDTGIDAAAVIDFARYKGTPSLAELSFAQRGELLRAIAEVLVANRDRYFEIARLNSGNTKTDAAIDIDGGIGTLRAYARHGKLLGAAHLLIEPGQEQLARDPIFFARHVWTTRPGVALQINAFNFPSWGMWEKVATALLAGVASVAKPATASAWLAHEMVRDVVAAGVLPAGALNLVCGSGKTLVECLGPMDSLAFTGSADTGLRLRRAESVLRNAPRINIEADSINATLIGPDAVPGSVVFDLARRELVKALSIKAGQLCTNIRRVFVHESTIGGFADAVSGDIGNITVGDPANEAVRMGPLIDLSQRAAALDGIERLKRESTVVAGGGVPSEVAGADAKAGAFLDPTVLRCDDPVNANAVHQVEVFGPCATLMPYRSIDQATSLATRSGGSLALSLFSDDPEVHKQTVAELGPWHGRLLVVDSTVGKNHTGHAIVMPQCVHGGPGRAGGGEELGGLRGLRLHMQRSALQGSPSLFDTLTADAAEAVL